MLLNGWNGRGSKRLDVIPGCGLHTLLGEIVTRAAAAGGKADVGPRQEMAELMYGRSFEDPDGHHWEAMWMDSSFAEQGAHPAEPVDA